MLRQRPAGDVLAASLELLERFDHRWIAYELILFHPGAFSLVTPETIERLADDMGSWGDVDQFGVLVAGPAWRAGQIDDSVVHAWASRPDRWWRRAALVACTTPTRCRHSWLPTTPVWHRGSNAMCATNSPLAVEWVYGLLRHRHLQVGMSEALQVILCRPPV